MGDPFLVVNPLLERSAFDSSSPTRQVLCELPDAAGKVYRFVVPEQFSLQLDAFDGRTSLQVLRHRLVGDGSGTAAAENFERLVREHFIPRRILLEVGEERNLQTPRLPDRPSYMLAKRRLLSPGIVNVVAHPLRRFYDRALAIPVLVLAAAAQLAFYAVIEPGFTRAAGGLAAEQVLMGLLLVLGGLFAHEFGHAAAAYRQGCRNVEIGFGWYICFVVFYADLSEAWRLSRKQRVIIDCGGMYFQTIYTACLIGFYCLVPSPAIFYAILLMNFALIWNLNPFLRLDGYWLASDMLGIPNLREEASQAMGRLMRRWTRRGGPGAAEGLGAGVTMRLAVYTLLSNLFFVWMAWLIAHHLLWGALRDLSLRGATLAGLLDTGATPAELVVAVGGSLWRVLTIAGISFFVFQAGRRVFRMIATARASR